MASGVTNGFPSTIVEARLDEVQPSCWDPCNLQSRRFGRACKQRWWSTSMCMLTTAAMAVVTVESTVTSGCRIATKRLSPEPSNTLTNFAECLRARAQQTSLTHGSSQALCCLGRRVVGFSSSRSSRFWPRVRDLVLDWM